MVIAFLVMVFVIIPTGAIAGWLICYIVEKFIGWYCSCENDQAAVAILHSAIVAALAAMFGFSLGVFLAWLKSLTGVVE